MKQKILLIVLTLTCCYSCGLNVTLLENTYIKRPVRFDVESIPDNKFRVSLFVQNVEESFNGYNLYIRESPITQSEINTIVHPLTIDGSLPTFKFTIDDLNLNKAFEYTISSYGEFNFLFEEDIIYYFVITAKSYLGLESRISNQIERIAITQ